MPRHATLARAAGLPCLPACAPDFWAVLLSSRAACSFSHTC